MMILLHGDYQLKSRQRLHELLNQAKADNKEIVWFNGLKINPTQLTQALEAGGLFGQERLIIIENFFSRPQSQTKKTLLAILKKNADQAVIFWEKKAVDGRSLKSLNFIKTELFKMPAVIFKFLDNFRPNNLKSAWLFLHQALEQNPAELVFYLLSGRLRQLIIAQTAPKKLTGAPWQRSQLHRQAEAFNLNQLLQLYQQLLAIDTAVKTGQSVWPLESQLDLLLCDL